MVDAGDPIMGVQRVGRERSAELRRRAAPAVAAERDPGEYYDACRRWDVDALFVMAMSRHESSVGRQGTAAGGHGPEPTPSRGYARLPSCGVQPALNPDGSPKLVRGRSGEFPVYRTRAIGQVFLGTDGRRPAT